MMHSINFKEHKRNLSVKIILKWSYYSRRGCHFKFVFLVLAPVAILFNGAEPFDQFQR